METSQLCVYAFESLVVMEFGYKNINLPENEKIVLEWLVGVYVYACVYVYVSCVYVYV